jgi:outer membrane protein OmpA-like peptidoglycan-associated protein
MASTVENDNGGLHWLVAAILLALLIILWLLGYGPGGTMCKTGAVSAAAPAAEAVVAASPPAAPVATAPATPTPAVATPAVAASETTTQKFMVVDAVPAAKVYFGLDKTDLPDDVDKTLAKVVEYLKAHPENKAQISGFHDPSGNKAHNEELALNRARAVRGALDKLGISRERVVMQKPLETTGTGSNAEARRVEVSVVKP